MESSLYCNGNEISLGFIGAISTEMNICKPHVIGSAFFTDVIQWVCESNAHFTFALVM